MKNENLLPEEKRTASKKTKTLISYKVRSDYDDPDRCVVNHDSLNCDATGLENTTEFTNRTVDHVDKNDNLIPPSSAWRSRLVFLYLADQLLSGLVIGPLTVLYWRGTWTLLGRHVFPNRVDVNGWICVVVGIAGLMCMLYGQRFFRRTLDVKKMFHWVVGFHAYTYLFGILNVCHWRGVWMVLDHYTGINAVSCWVTFAIGQVSLWILRSSRNSLAPPMVVVMDRDQELFAYSTRFKTKVQNTELYFLDATFTIGVVHTLVVFYWRGTWELFDVYVFPNHRPYSAVATLIIAYSLQVLVGLIQPVFNAAYRRTSSQVARWALETITFFVANIVGVAHWRGFWLLCDEYILPAKPDVSNVLTHVVGIVVLMLMQCGHSVALQGCDIEGDTKPEHGCYVPNDYFRHFFPSRKEQQPVCSEVGSIQKPLSEESLSMMKMSSL